jgi:hypothetical protein
MARKLTEDFIGTCQYCLGEYKVNARKQVVLHGYQRPGYGHIIGNCQGVGHAPFEYEKKLTEQRIVSMKDDIAKLDRQIKMIDSGKVDKVPNPSFVPEKERQSRWYRHSPEHDITHIGPDHQRFDQVLKLMRANLESEKSFIGKLVAFFEELVANWKPGQIVGIDSPATGKVREMRDAYNPDEEAKRAEARAAKAARDAKPGKITLSVWTRLPFPSRDDNLSNEEWTAAITAHYAAEKQFKEEIKAWAKAKFPGKVWVGDGDEYEVERASGIKQYFGGEKTTCVAIRPDWQHLDAIMNMFPNAHRMDKDAVRDRATKQGVGKGKQIGLWVKATDLPK